MTKLITKTIYSLDSVYESAAIVQPGEIFKVQVTNAFGRSFKDINDLSTFMENEKEKKAFNHPCTGPIEVCTACEHISLAIEVLDIKPSKGFQCISKSTGFLKDEFFERGFKIFDFAKGDSFCYNTDIELHASPSIGFLATFDEHTRSPGRCCENGGNIDLNFLNKGSTLYLPVNHTSARIAVGDLHIAQGNGEAAGIALEADGEITLRVRTVAKVNFPIIDNAHVIVVVGWGDNLESSLKQCTKNALEFLKRIFPICNWSDVDIYQFISIEGNLVLGNATGKVVTCGMVFHKDRVRNKFKYKVWE